MIVIRLARSGAKKRPYYQVQVADSRSPRDGKYIERVGYYNPLAQKGEVRCHINLERLEHWIGTGAQPSARVASLLRDYRKLEAPEDGITVTDEMLKRRKAKRQRANPAEAEAEAQTEASAEADAQTEASAEPAQAQTEASAEPQGTGADSGEDGAESPA